jgi:hypothetical protein
MPDEAGDTPLARPSDELERDGKADDEGDDDQDLAGQLIDPNFTVLMDEIGRRFERATTLDEAGLQLTTQQVFERLQTFYPSEYYSPRLVFDGLTKLGFTYDDPFKDMNYVWLFK